MMHILMKRVNGWRENVSILNVIFVARGQLSISLISGSTYLEDGLHANEVMDLHR
jgi:hypothetical protein